MYGNCQVLTSMGGNNGGGGAVSPDLYFSSQMGQNPNFPFISNINMPFNIFPPIIPKEGNATTLLMKSKEEMETSASGSEHIEGLSGNEQETEQLVQQQQDQTMPTNSKKKRYHRHTARQIQEMEGLFKECPHPDDKQRQKLSQDLGLTPRQVKFWFQNRRTQMKAQQDRAENVVLRAENDNLRTENYRLQAALRNIICPSCGGPAMMGEMSYDEQQLRIENARLKEEFERVCCLVSQYSGRPIQGMGPTALLAPSLDLDMGIFPRKLEHEMSNCVDMVAVPFIPENSHFSEDGGPLILEEEKAIAMQMAISAMDEIIKMCQTRELLWVPSGENGKEMLNLEEYTRMFPWPVGINRPQASELRIEATRDSAVVIMNSITLVDALLDAGKWMELFPCIVAKAKAIQVVMAGVSGHASGSLQLMYAELQALTPLLPTRECYFLRYCHQNAEEGSWVIVDFPLESVQSNFPPSFPYYKRRPSGCVIQDMPNGYSRVTWIEHSEVEETQVNQIFSDYVSSGMAFGAQRWLAVLQRQCERFASLMARNISDIGVIPSPEARKNMINLGQRMVKTFCLNISTSFGQSWTALSDSADDTVRITTRKVTEPGQPNGLVLSAVSTTWLHYSHHRVFHLLRDERRRAQLDVLSNGNSLQEVAHIANGSHTGNCISLLRINVASNSSQSVELMLQESCIDDSSSLIVYATVDVEAIQLAMNGEDPACIPLLPVGFVITPLGHSNATASATTVTRDSGESKPLENRGPTESGCLLTVGLQVLASTIPSAKLNLSSVTAINHHLCNTVQQINAMLSAENGDSVCGSDQAAVPSSAAKATDDNSAGS